MPFADQLRARLEGWTGGERQAAITLKGPGQGSKPSFGFPVQAPAGTLLDLIGGGANEEVAGDPVGSNSSTPPFP